MKVVYLFFQVLNGLTKNISSTKSHLGKNSQEGVLDILPNTTKDKLLDVSQLQLFPRFLRRVKKENEKDWMERKDKKNWG